MKKKIMKRSGMENPILPAPQGDRFEIRWCGCPKPKDYPNIDIHNSKCKRRSRLQGPTVGIRDVVPKVGPSGRQLSRSDAPRTVTPTHQSKQWFFGHDYSAFVDPGGSVWLAMAKRFDKRYNKP
jgi:hypothetical protein